MQPDESTQYLVIAANGEKYGPADMAVLISWCSEGRIAQNTLLERVDTGLQLPASQVLTQFSFPPLADVSQPTSHTDVMEHTNATTQGENPRTLPDQPTPVSFNPLYGTASSTAAEAARSTPLPQRGPQSLNTSGMNIDVPPEVEAMKWNWGAFGLGWIWLCGMNRVMAGIILVIGYTVFQMLVSLISNLYLKGRPMPLTFAVSVIMFFIGLSIQIYLGRKGNSMAWRYRRFDSVQHFIDVQTKWAMAGIIFFLCSFTATVLVYISTFTLSGLFHA